jgi:hypothetical protein
MVTGAEYEVTGATAPKTPKEEFVMNAKDTFIGTAKRLVAEIVGDGRLAEERSRQTGGNEPLSASHANADFLPQERSGATDASFSQASPPIDENRFAMLLGYAALKVWSDLPQERLFTAAAHDGVIANSLAMFLHDRHPKTAHPPKPTQIA